MGKSRGFSLIEVLVAMVVLAVGLLGLAGLQLKGLQSAHMAHQRTLATLVAEDAAERLWAWYGEQTTETCPGTDELERLRDEWREHWAGQLPGFAEASDIAPQSVCRFVIRADWREARQTASQQAADPTRVNLDYAVSLPGA